MAANTKVITFEAYGETWSSVSSFAREHSNGDIARFERIRSRLYKGLCTAEQAIELERYHGEHRRLRMMEMREENEAKGVVVVNGAKGPPVPKPFAPFGGHHDDLRMRLELVEKTSLKDTTTYAVTFYCCGREMLMTHAQLLRRIQGGFKYCQPCARSGGRRRAAASRISTLLDMTEEERDNYLVEYMGVAEHEDVEPEKDDRFFHGAYVFRLEAPPPPSVLSETRRAYNDCWEDRMYRQWRET